MNRVVATLRSPWLNGHWRGWLGVFRREYRRRIYHRAPRAAGVLEVVRCSGGEWLKKWVRRNGSSSQDGWSVGRGSKNGSISKNTNNKRVSGWWLVAVARRGANALMLVLFRDHHERKRRWQESVTTVAAPP